MTPKQGIATLTEVLGINNLGLFLLSKRYSNNYIRVINYHHVKAEDIPQFIKQLKWFSKKFQFINYSRFDEFMKGRLILEKPGILLTFDDGYKDNYNVAEKILPEFGDDGIGWFMISSGLIGHEGYLTKEEIRRMIDRGHVIACHTESHHRMLEDDSNDILKTQITDSKAKLERMFNIKCKVFCWCGGEEEHYTSKAEYVIENSGFEYSFMTNSEPVTSMTDRFHIQRSNIEANNSISLMKFQISGLMDIKYNGKRDRVNKKTGLRKEL